MEAARRSNRYLQLAAAMIRTGILGFGGGPSVIPLIRYEAVSRYAWIKDEEFGEVLAVANALPGPIATKIAAYLGYREKGWSGACLALAAHILPSSAAMMLLMSIVRLLSRSAVVAGMIAAIVPVIAVMIGMMAYEFGQRSIKGLGWAAAAAAFAATFLLLEVVSVHPAIVVALFLGYGAFHYRIAERVRDRLKRSQRQREEEA